MLGQKLAPVRSQSCPAFGQIASNNIPDALILRQTRFGLQRWQRESFAGRAEAKSASRLHSQAVAAESERRDGTKLTVRRRIHRNDVNVLVWQVACRWQHVITQK